MRYVLLLCCCVCVFSVLCSCASRCVGDPRCARSERRIAELLEVEELERMMLSDNEDDGDGSD